MLLARRKKPQTYQLKELLRSVGLTTNSRTKKMKKLKRKSILPCQWAPCQQVLTRWSSPKTLLITNLAMIWARLRSMLVSSSWELCQLLTLLLVIRHVTYGARRQSDYLRRWLPPKVARSKLSRCDMMKQTISIPKEMLQKKSPKTYGSMKSKRVKTELCINQLISNLPSNKTVRKFRSTWHRLPHLFL